MIKQQSLEMKKVNQLRTIVFAITLILGSFISDSTFINAQSDNNSTGSELPRPPKTGTPTGDSSPGGTRSPWDEQILELENQWEEIYESYFKTDFSSLSLSPKQISEKLAQLKEQTGKNPAVIWMAVRKEGLFIFLVTPKGQSIGTRIPVASQKTIFPVIQQFLRHVSNADSTSYLKPAQKLYQWMITPIEYYLLSEKIDTLILCVGPGLRSFPFAALHDGQRFLIEKYSLTRIPGFNLTEWNVSSLNQAQVLAMGASEFDNAEPLPGVAVEISKITPDPWGGVAILNQDFTVANLQKNRQQKPFEIVHLATHAKFNSGNPSNSYIRFVDTQLTLKQMGEFDWHEPPVELLVLSACETLLGDKNAELGFVGLAIQGGVKSAIGSLWRVSDLGTLAMMSEFYQQLKVKPLKAEALRQAQIAMIKEHISLTQSPLQTSVGASGLTSEIANLEKLNLSHPYYWASFSLIGNPF